MPVLKKRKLRIIESSEEEHVGSLQSLNHDRASDGCFDTQGVASQQATDLHADSDKGTSIAEEGHLANVTEISGLCPDIPHTSVERNADSDKGATADEDNPGHVGILEGDELDRYLFGPSGNLDYSQEDVEDNKSVKSSKTRKHKRRRRVRMKLQASPQDMAAVKPSRRSRRRVRSSTDSDADAASGAESCKNGKSHMVRSKPVGVRLSSNASVSATGGPKMFRIWSKTRDPGCRLPPRQGSKGRGSAPGHTKQSRECHQRSAAIYYHDMEDAEGECVLPHLVPEWPPAQSHQPSSDELQELIPSVCPSCPVRVPRARKLTSTAMRIPIGQACSYQERSDQHLLLNTGNIVAAVAWCPGELETGVTVLTLGVHGRLHPVTCIDQRAAGLGAIQFWRLNTDGFTATLCLGIVHEGVCARMLQWVPRSKTASRLGLLLVVLGSGNLELHAVPLDPLLQKDDPAGNLSVAGDEIFWRLTPAWTAPVSVPGSSPEQEWERRICSAAARPGAEPGSCIIVGGCDLCVVLLWSLNARDKRPTGPLNVLHAASNGDPIVHSLAWAPSGGPYIFAAGLGNGHVMIWDIRRPLVPIHDFFTQVRAPIWNLEWKTPLEILARQMEGVVYNISTGKTSRTRHARLRGESKRGIHCAGLCHVGNKVGSVWTDGLCCLEEFPSKDVRRSTQRTASSTNSWQLALFTPISEPVASISVTAAGIDACPVSGKAEDEPGKFLAELKERFLAKQADSISSLRAWETQDGAFVFVACGRTPHKMQLAQEAHLAAVSDGETEVSGAQGTHQPSVAAAEPSLCKLSHHELPLTGLAARPFKTSAKMTESWLLAYSSAAGLVHVTLVSGK